MLDEMLADSATLSGGCRIGSGPPRALTDEQNFNAERVASLTGMRAVAALLVVGTHAAYGTGMLSHGYVGMLFLRLEIGVSIFFVLSGFLLFRPWVRAAATSSTPPLVSRYARRRLRRVMPAYIVTVLVAYLVYQFRSAGPNPGHTWLGLLQHLTLTQIYSDTYVRFASGTYPNVELAVEVAFYAALPVLAYLLLAVMCRGRWRSAVGRWCGWVKSPTRSSCST